MDREKVISQVEEEVRLGKHWDESDRTIDMELLENVLLLLKEQEAVEPKLVGVNTWTCGECGALLGWEEFSRSGLELVKYKYCPECGKKLKWND